MNKGDINLIKNLTNKNLPEIRAMMTIRNQPRLFLFSTITDI